MKKILCIAIAVFTTMAMAHAEGDEPGNIGLGYQGIFHDGFVMDNISLRSTPEPLGWQAVIGHWKSDDRDGGTDYEEWSFTGRALYTIIDRPNSDFYVGPSLSLNLYEEGSSDGTYWTLGALAGAEWRFQELPELGFNFEVGYGVLFADDDGYDEINKGTQVSLGAHYYF